MIFILRKKMNFILLFIGIGIGIGIIKDIYMQKKFIILIQLTILSFLANTLNAQQVTVTDEGKEITEYENTISFYDPFTDELTIRSKGFNVSITSSNRDTLKVMSAFVGTKECGWTDVCGEYKIIIVSENTSILEVFNINQLMLSKEYPIIFDNDRDKISITAIKTDRNFNEESIKEEFEDLSADELIFLLLLSSLFDENIDENLQSEIYEYGYSTALVVNLTYDQLLKLSTSDTIRMRVEGNVVSFGEKIQGQLFEIDKILDNMRREKYLESKDLTNELNQSPYELKWEGNIERDPMIQPLPDNVSNSEGVISVRFQVKPDGTVGLIIPLKNMDTELEKEVQKTLRSWKFSRLPSGVPQQAQWGTITFRFVFD